MSPIKSERESLRQRRKPTSSYQASVGNDSGRRSRYGHRRWCVTLMATRQWKTVAIWSSSMVCDANVLIVVYAGV
ncbi:hypothetical protein HanPI659440_Chr11g0434211 [Helianthus annuus]|nr:hypothetical protein HanPI659440_Chr11g0434211 [Helianthus annuus]